MEFLGVGPTELTFIIIIALILLGPKDMQKAGASIGRWLRKLVTSDGWKAFQQTSHEIQNIPNRLMREAALEELEKLPHELNRGTVPGIGSILVTGAESNENPAANSAGAQPDPHD